MEARRFGFGACTPPANKFDPTDEDIVAYYLLPRAAGVANPYAHAVIDDDPYGCPPWELLRRHGHDGSGHAFFFVPPRETTRKRNAGRMSRVVGPGGVGGGVWRGQKGEDKALVIVRGDGDGDGELTVRFRRYNLAYHRKGDRRSSGWVMHEYHVVHPELRPGAGVARIKISDKAKKMGKRQQWLSPPSFRDQTSRAPATTSSPSPTAVMPPGTPPRRAKRSVVGDGEGFNNSYFSEGFGSNYCFNENGEGSGDNFLQEDGGGCNFLQDDGGNGD